MRWWGQFIIENKNIPLCTTHRCFHNQHSRNGPVHCRYLNMESSWSAPVVIFSFILQVFKNLILNVFYIFSSISASLLRLVTLHGRCHNSLILCVISCFNGGVPLKKIKTIASFVQRHEATQFSLWLQGFWSLGMMIFDVPRIDMENYRMVYRQFYLGSKFEWLTNIGSIFSWTMRCNNKKLWLNAR